MLRDAIESDLTAIRRWRNQERVRAVSLTSHEITPDEHRRWWRRVCADVSRRVLVYERAGVPAGVVNLFDHDPDARTVSWGYFLDLDGLTARGEALAAWLEVQREALDYAFDELDVDTLLGEVLEHNTVVRRMNRRLGFVEGAPRTATLDGRGIRVYPIRLDRATRERRLQAEVGA